jgi:hypothetical protein
MMLRVDVELFTKGCTPQQARHTDSGMNFWPLVGDYCNFANNTNTTDTSWQPRCYPYHMAYQSSLAQFYANFSTAWTKLTTSGMANKPNPACGVGVFQVTDNAATTTDKYRWKIDGVDSGTLTLYRGCTYKFEIHTSIPWHVNSSGSFSGVYSGCPPTTCAGVSNLSGVWATMTVESEANAQECILTYWTPGKPNMSGRINIADLPGVDPSTCEHVDPPPTCGRNWVIRNSGTTAYSFVKSTSVVGVTVTALNPNITLIEGCTYYFSITSMTHPFYIKTVAGTGTASQVTAGVSGAGTSLVRYTVPIGATNAFYQCSYHAKMKGHIIIERAFATKHSKPGIPVVLGTGAYVILKTPESKPNHGVPWQKILNSETRRKGKTAFKSPAKPT